MSTKRVLAIHDLCSFGRCSLTAAIPVISALGSQVCPFPTALFSNNLTYGTFKSTDLSATMPDMMAAWSKLNLTYDAVYSGFLAGPDQAETVKEAVLQFGKGGLSIIDPAMADNGKLYPVFDESMIKAMKSLITVADLITPNYTEAALLSDTEVDFSATPTTKSVLEMCKTLSADGPQRIVITSVPSRDGIKNISYDATTATFDEAVTYKVDFSTCGTGDIFTSALTGLLLMICMLQRQLPHAFLQRPLSSQPPPERIRGKASRLNPAWRISSPKIGPKNPLVHTYNTQKRRIPSDSPFLLKLQH